MTVQPSRPARLLEVEGLRALAVTAVVLYHAGFGVSGGYVGVDVFFVLSGFLITRLLLDEVGRTRRVSLLGFAARRARRLLPAAAVVLVAVVLVSASISGELRAHATAVDATWAAALLANVRFAAVGADYLRSTAPPSLLQHWWSLAVEEQFYVVWPLMVAVVTTRASRTAARARLAVVAVAVAGVSLWWSVTHVHSNPVHAYFLPWSRAWELLVGALLACGWEGLQRLRWRGVLGWVGLAVVVASCVRFDRTTAFPGVAALAPVLGTAAIVVSIGGRGGTNRLLSVRPLQWLGSRSYTLYLWHWPALMLLADRTPHASAGQRAAVVAASLVLAHVTTLLIERPVRSMRVLTASNVHSLLVGAACIITALSAASVVAVATRHPTVDTGYVAPTLPSATTAATTVPPSVSPTVSPTVSTVGTTAGPTTASSSTATTTTLDPIEALSAAEADRAQLVAASAAYPIVPSNVEPPLERQASDRPVVYADGCLVGYGRQRVPPCVYGDTNSPTTIALLGDSHVAQWFPPVLAVAVEHHWRLVVVTKMGCPGLALPVTYDHDVPYPDCTAWQPAAIERVLSEHPAIVIMGNWRAKYSLDLGGKSGYITDQRWTSAYTDVITPLRAAGTRVLLLSDAPIARMQVDQCLSAHLRNTAPCTTSVELAIDQRANGVLREVAQRTGSTFHDTASWFCTATVCPPIVGNVAVYLNDNHINATYAETLTPLMSRVLEAALRT